MTVVKKYIIDIIDYNAVTEAVDDNYDWWPSIDYCYYSVMTWYYDDKWLKKRIMKAIILLLIWPLKKWRSIDYWSMTKYLNVYEEMSSMKENIRQCHKMKKWQ